MLASMLARASPSIGGASRPAAPVRRPSDPVEGVAESDRCAGLAAGVLARIADSAHPVVIRLGCAWNTDLPVRYPRVIDSADAAVSERRSSPGQDKKPQGLGRQLRRRLRRVPIGGPPWPGATHPLC